MLTFYVKENTVLKYFTGKEYVVPTDSINAIPFKFVFDETWDTFREGVTCQITQIVEGERTTYNLALDENNIVYVPAEIVPGYYFVSVFGYRGLEARNTVIPLMIEVVKSGFVLGGQPPVPPSPDLYQQILNEINKRYDATDANMKSFTDSINTKVAEQDNKISKKADSTYVDSENANQNKVIETKADKVDVDEKNKLQDTEIENLKTSKEDKVILNKEANGNPVIINGTIEAPFRELVIKGKTEQKTTSGKNLLDYMNGHFGTEERFVFINDGISMDIPSSELISRRILVFNVQLPAGTYVVSCVKTHISGNNPILRLQLNDEYYRFYSNSLKFTVNENIFRFNIYIDLVDVTEFPTKLQFTNIQLEEGSEATSYEPYTCGMPSPSPDYPQEIISAGASGSIETKVGGKNLVTPNDIFSFGDNNKFIFKDRSFIIKKGVAYTVSTRQNVGTITLLTKSGETITYVNGRRSLTYTPTSDIDIKVQLFSHEGSIIEDIQFEIGDKPTDYEVGKLIQTVSVSTPNGLNGIGDIHDEIDFASGKKIQRFKKRVFNGSINENWIKGRMISLHLNDIKKILPSDKAIVQNIKCSSYVAKSANYAYQKKENCFGLADGSILWFSNMDYNSKTVEEWKAYLSQSPIEVVYPLETPIITDIPQEEMEAYRNSYTNEDSTTIWSDDKVDYHIEYATDNNISKALNEKATKSVERGLFLDVDNPIFRVDGNGVPYPQNQKAVIKVKKKYIDEPVHWDVRGKTIPDGTEQVEVDINEMVSKGVVLKNVLTKNTDTMGNYGPYPAVPYIEQLAINIRKCYIKVDVKALGENVNATVIIRNNSQDIGKLQGNFTSGQGSVITISGVLNPALDITELWIGSSPESNVQNVMLIDITELSAKYPQYTDEQLKKILDESLPYISAQQSKTLGGVCRLENLVPNPFSTEGWTFGNNLTDTSISNGAIKFTTDKVVNFAGAYQTSKQFSRKIKANEKVCYIVKNINGTNSFGLGIDYGHVYGSNIYYDYPNEKRVGIRCVVGGGIMDSSIISFTPSDGILAFEVTSSLLDLWLSLNGYDTDEKKAEWCNEHIPAFEGTYDLVLSIEQELPVVVTCDNYSASCRIEVVENLNSALNLYRAVGEAFEEGENYIKFRDGTAMCWGTEIFNKVGNNWENYSMYLFSAELVINKNFPFAFKSMPQVFCMFDDFSNNGIIYSVLADNMKLKSIKFVKNAKTEGLYGINWLAVGRWK